MKDWGGEGGCGLMGMGTQLPDLPGVTEARDAIILKCETTAMNSDLV